MSETNKAALSRAIDKMLRSKATRTLQGTFEFTDSGLSAVATDVAETVSLRPGDREETEYDPEKHGQEMARRQIGESRNPDSDAWR